MCEFFMHSHELSDDSIQWTDCFRSANQANPIIQLTVDRFLSWILAQCKFQILLPESKHPTFLIRNFFNSKIKDYRKCRNLITNMGVRVTLARTMFDLESATLG